MSEKKGFFEELASAAGRQMDHGAENLSKGLGKILGTSSPPGTESTKRKNNADPVDYIVDHFANLMKTKKVEYKHADPSFDYSEILIWAQQHHKKENQLYLIKGTLDDGRRIVCVFFANSDVPQLDGQAAKTCYICDSIPVGINDLFGAGSIYVQPLK